MSDSIRKLTELRDNFQTFYGQLNQKSATIEELYKSSQRLYDSITMLMNELVESFNQSKEDDEILLKWITDGGKVSDDNIPGNVLKALNNRNSHIASTVESFCREDGPQYSEHLSRQPVG